MCRPFGAPVEWVRVTQGFLPPVGGQSPWAIPCRPVRASDLGRAMTALCLYATMRCVVGCEVAQVNHFAVGEPLRRFTRLLAGLSVSRNRSALPALLPSPVRGKETCGERPNGCDDLNVDHPPRGEQHLIAAIRQEP